MTEISSKMNKPLKLVDSISASSEPTIKDIGGIDEEGILNNLTRMGMSVPLSYHELVGNVVDACQLYPKLHYKKIKITFYEDGEYLHIVDNCPGGMDEETLKRYSTLYKKGDNKEKRIGVSGIGGKSALLCLSKIKQCFINTKDKDGNYWICSLDWEKIIENKKITGNIRLVKMTDNEQKKFKDLREKCKMSEQGTTISILINDEVINFNQKIFGSPTDLDYTQRLDTVFGQIDDIEIKHLKINDPEYLGEIKPFNLFNLPKSNYYFDNESIDVHIYQDNDDVNIIYPVYEINGEKKYFKTDMGAIKSYKFPPKKIISTYIGDMTLKLCMLLDKQFFDPYNPTKNTNADSIPTYLEKKLYFAVN